MQSVSRASHSRLWTNSPLVSHTTHTRDLLHERERFNAMYAVSQAFAPQAELHLRTSKAFVLFCGTAVKNKNSH